MTSAKTLLELAGADLTPAKLSASSLVLIDYQNEYLSGPIAVSGAEAAIRQARRLLDRARAGGIPVIHVVHRGRAGGLFDLEAERGKVIAELSPALGEAVVEKSLPNAFAGTTLRELLTAAGRDNIVVAGFMTHMCVSATARAALDFGYRVTVDARSCATRDLPDGQGGSVPAELVHRIALIELSDRFSVISYGDEVLA